MRDLYARCHERVAAARDAGVPLYAGSDAGSMVAHGRIADEVEALKGIGMSPTEALGAACWDARRWLGRPGLDHGASADLLCYSAGPAVGSRRAQPARSGGAARQNLSTAGLDTALTSAFVRRHALSQKDCE